MTSLSALDAPNRHIVISMNNTGVGDIPWAVHPHLAGPAVRLPLLADRYIKPVEIGVEMPSVKEVTEAIRCLSHTVQMFCLSI